MKFHVLPEQLSGLSDPKERLIASRLPFMQLRPAKTGGQWKLNDNVINVVANVDTTAKSLPRAIDETKIIPVKLKRK